MLNFLQWQLPPVYLASVPIAEENDSITNLLHIRSLQNAVNYGALSHIQNIIFNTNLAA